MPLRCRCQAKRAFARAFLNLLRKVGVIVPNSEGEDKVAQPKGHQQWAQSAYRDQCAASSQQRSIEMRLAMLLVLKVPKGKEVDQEQRCKAGPSFVRYCTRPRKKVVPVGHSGRAQLKRRPKSAQQGQNANGPRIDR